MASSPHQAKLRPKAEWYCQALQADGLNAELDEQSWREYHVKVAILDGGLPCGAVMIYYAPSKDSFSAKFHEVSQREYVPRLERLWHSQAGFSAPTAVPVPDIPAVGWQAYVDGAWLKGRVGWGVVILCDGAEKARLSGAVPDPDGVRQVAGELRAVREALAWCEAQGVPELEIIYDYTGIENWARGKWKTNTPTTQAYAELMRQQTLKLKWRKVPAHMGVKWNELADGLAKSGATRK